MKYSEQLVVSGYWFSLNVVLFRVHKVQVLVRFNIVFIPGPAHPPKVKYSEKIVVSGYWFSLTVLLFPGTQGTGRSTGSV